MRVSGKSRHVASSRATTAVSGCVPALHMLKVVSTLSSSLSVATHQKRKGNGGREALLLVASMRELLPSPWLLFLRVEAPVKSNLQTWVLVGGLMSCHSKLRTMFVAAVGVYCSPRPYNRSIFLRSSPDACCSAAELLLYVRLRLSTTASTSLRLLAAGRMGWND